MFGIGSWEFIIIAVLALLLFGPDKLPQFARTIGRFTRDFKRYKDLIESTLRAEVYASDVSVKEDPFKKGKEFREKVESGEIGRAPDSENATTGPDEEDTTTSPLTPAERAETLPAEHPLKAAMAAGQDVGIDDDLDLASFDAEDLGWVPGRQSGGEVSGDDA